MAKKPTRRGRPAINLHDQIKAALAHAEPLPAPASRPLDNLEERINDAVGMLKYIDERLTSLPVYAAVYERHTKHLRRMVFVSLVESFERFLKELAVLCVDHLAHYINDGRFDDLSATGGEIAAQFAAGSVGKAVFESDTWLSNSLINRRFRQLLKTPFGDPWSEFLLPERNQLPEGEREPAATMAILWQVRHSITHNVGVLTASDALKLGVLCGAMMPADRLFTPETRDIRYVKRFLIETARRINRRVGVRLADVLSDIHASAPALFDADAVVRDLAGKFGVPLTVDGGAGTP